MWLLGGSEPAASRWSFTDCHVCLGAGLWAHLLQARSSQPTSPNDDRYNADEYVGLSLDDARRRAQTAGLDVRLLGTDGECESHDSDARLDRVNFYVESDEVMGAARY